MKAMILAAGLGTRLRPLTNDRPKALVHVQGKTLLERAIRRLQAAGFDELVINVHHFADLIIAHLEENDHFGMQIHISDERDRLLNTGGAIKKAAGYFTEDEPFLLCNADILSDIDLNRFYHFHRAQQPLASLAVRRRDSSRYLIFDEHEHLCGWQNIGSGAIKIARPVQGQLSAKAFSGFHVIHPDLFRYFPDEAVFSIIDVYLMAAAEDRVIAYQHDEDNWMDVGRPEQLAFAQGVDWLD